jgi:hypothetical protein
LNDAQRNVVLSSHHTIAGSEKQAYGWFVNEQNPKKYFHGGGTWGYSSLLAYYPTSKISVIVLSNVSTLAMESIGQDIEKIVFGLPFEMPKIETEVQSRKNVVYTGEYISDSGKKLTVVQNGDYVLMQLAGNPPFQIYAKGDHRFFGKKVEIDILFTTNDDEVEGLTATRMGQTFRFKKQ